MYVLAFIFTSDTVVDVATVEWDLLHAFSRHHSPWYQAKQYSSAEELYTQACWYESCSKIWHRWTHYWVRRMFAILKFVSHLISTHSIWEYLLGMLWLDLIVPQRFCCHRRTIRSLSTFGLLGVFLPKWWVVKLFSKVNNLPTNHGITLFFLLITPVYVNTLGTSYLN